MKKSSPIEGGDLLNGDQPLDRAWTTPKRRVANVVPAPMREDPTGNDRPLDRAWTTPKPRVAKVVPAPMREDPTGNAQPLDRAWTNRMATNRVPAPRLELGTP
jgi:hypothetical protein